MQKTEDREVVHLYTVYKYCTSNGCGDQHTVQHSTVSFIRRSLFSSLLYVGDILSEL